MSSNSAGKVDYLGIRKRRTHAQPALNLTQDYQIVCGKKVVGVAKRIDEARRILALSPAGSFIHYPLGKMRDHLIAKARKESTRASGA